MLRLWLAVAAGAGLFLLAHALPPSRLQVFLSVWPPLLWGAAGCAALLHAAPLPLHVTGGRAGKWLAASRRIPDALFLGILFIAVAAACGWLSGALFDRVPHVNDSLNQYIHAKFVASGHVSLPSHPLKEFFDSGWMINDGRWYSPYSPGHILLLAIGHLAGLPWLVNPLLGAATVIAVYFLAREMYGQATARLSALLAALCPLILFMSSEFMNHASALWFATLFMLFFLRALRTREIRDAAPAGLCLGLLALSRPYTAVGIALPYAALGLWHLCKDFRAYVRPFAAMALALSACALFQLWWNLKTTGDPFLMAYSKLFTIDAMPGLGKNPYGGAGGGHSLADGLMTLADRFVMMNEMLFEWPLPSLMFVALMFIGGAVRRRDVVLLSTYLSLAGAYALFIGRSDVFGPRYHYEAATALVTLTAAAIVRLPDILKRLFGAEGDAQSLYGRCAVILLVLFATSDIPFRYRLYSHDYPEVSHGYYRSIAAGVRTPALVFAPGDRTFLSLAFTFPPKESDPIIFAVDWGEMNGKLIAYYPCRYAYVKKEEGLLLVHNPKPGCR